MDADSEVPYSGQNLGYRQYNTLKFNKNKNSGHMNTTSALRYPVPVLSAVVLVQIFSSEGLLPLCT